MNLTTLMAARKRAFERLEAAKAKEHADSPDDRLAFLVAQKEYQDAEADLQRTLSMFTTEELVQQGLVA